MSKPKAIGVHDEARQKRKAFVFQALHALSQLTFDKYADYSD